MKPNNKSENWFCRCLFIPYTVACVQAARYFGPIGRLGGGKDSPRERGAGRTWMDCSHLHKWCYRRILHVTRKQWFVCICADLEKRDKGWALDVCGHIGGKEEKMERLGEGRTSVGRRGVVRKAGRQECRHFTMELRSVCTPSSQRKLLEIQTWKNCCWRPGSLILSIRQMFSIDLPSYYGSDESNIKVGWQIFSLQSTNTCSSLVLNSSCLICGMLASFIWIFFWKLRLEMIVQMCTAVMSVYLWCVLAEMSSSWVERVPVLDLILQGHLSTWESTNWISSLKDTCN